MTVDTKTYPEFIKAFDLKTNEPLKKYTSFRIGGPADLLALPRTRNELAQLIRHAEKLQVPVHIFGGGSNLLISDKGIRGLVVFTSRLRADIDIVKETGKALWIDVLAGNRLSNVCQFAKENNLSGIEFAVGIPGTLGGAIKMNAGTSDGQMADIVEAIEILNTDMAMFETISRAHLNFDYRNLNLDAPIVSARILLNKNTSSTHVSVRFNQLLKRKNETQPVSARSAGCFFKNPVSGDPAGKLIESAGLKGKKINDAMVSDIHANYIINTGQATCKDILALKALVQQTVFEKYRIKLETEVRVEGEN